MSFARLSRVIQRECSEQGVTARNAWRRRYPKLVPDLSRALLIDLDLRGINLTRAHLARANLRQATLSRANLTRASLVGLICGQPACAVPSWTTTPT